MRRIFYLVRRREELPQDRNWLTPAELQVLSGLRFVKRRDDWLLGRWTAKQTLAGSLENGAESLSRWQVLAAHDGAPQVMLDGGRSDFTVSISHSAGTALCAVSPEGSAIGCDIEQVARRDDAFAETFLTRRERRSVAAASAPARALLTTLIWSTKESVLKLLHQGLKMDTWNIEVEAPPSLSPGGWRPVRARRADNDREFHGWWRHDGRYVCVLVAGGGGHRPINLEAESAAGGVTRLSGWR